LVRQVARKINAKRKKGVFLKLDIARAFDSLSWPFLFEVLRHLGFGPMWLRWIGLLLYTASVRVLVNGVPGRSIKLVRGLRQGDPTSPQLFVIAMEVLTLCFVKAAEEGFLADLYGCALKQRVSIYADDVALFIRPEVQDIVTAREILRCFGMASGLTVNYGKSCAIVIRGEALDKILVKHLLRCELGEFPCKYLGLQLSTGALSRAHWQPVLDKVIASLPAWQRGLLARSGRLVLIKSVVTARPIHQLLIMEAPAWLMEEIDKWTRAFFWAGKDTVNGGQCLVSWQQICKPVRYGGLGVHNLRLQGLALRVRWEWLRRTDQARPWQGLPGMKDKEAIEAFNSLVAIKLGDGAKVLFWTDRWIRGAAMKDLAPIVFESVGAQKRCKRTVSEALENHCWVDDVGPGLGPVGLLQCLRILEIVCTIQRDAAAEDVFAWPWSSSGKYDARSTYKMLCQGSVRWEGASCVWRSSAPLKCKIFAWLALQFRLWTSDRRVRHGLQEVVSTCYTCLQEVDSVSHVLMGCVFARQVWFRCLQTFGLELAIPTASDSLQSWWFEARKRFGKKEKRGFDTLVILISWRLWKQRNARVFGNITRQFSEEALVDQIMLDWELWTKAGLGGCVSFARVVH
jgi:hypothetical protein